jgi:hypothetical protein
MRTRKTKYAKRRLNDCTAHYAVSVPPQPLDEFQAETLIPPGAPQLAVGHGAIQTSRRTFCMENR